MAIELHYYKSEPPNFGDELNTLVWHALLPELEKTDSDGVLVGIGTILDWDIPQDREIFVIGPGAGQAPLPRGLKSERFHVLAVRGPLTAALAGLPADLAVTDPALLLREVYPQLMSLRNRATARPIFVPHIMTAQDRGWHRACELAGIEFVDPTWDCITILKKIASARLVIAEAMHAAIVADAFRIPWIPVASTRHFSTFKWVDWTLSLQVPFRLTVLPAVSTRHGCQRAWLNMFAEHCLVEGVSTGSGEAEVRSEAVATLLRRTARKLQSPVSGTGRWFRLKAAAFHRRLLDPFVARLFFRRGFDKHMERRVARLLSELAATPGYLSTDEICAARLRVLLERVQLLRARIAPATPECSETTAA